MVKDVKLVLAIAAVAIIWGTTFLGIRIAVESIPPWIVAGSRQLFASLLLMVLLLFRKELKWIGWKNLLIHIFLSSVMVVIANGLTTVAEQHVSSSLASLVSAISPLFVFIASVIVGIQKFTFRPLLGILLGFFGIVLIFKDSLDDLLNPDYQIGILLLFLAITGWAIGSVYTKMKDLSSQNISLNLFYQFGFAGLSQLALSQILSEKFKVQSWTAVSIGAVFYLAVFGSVVAFFAFHYALKKITPSEISLLSYVNTVIAIFLGWLILNEEISATFLAATVLIICGVFITNYKPGMFKRHKKQLP